MVVAPSHNDVRRLMKLFISRQKIVYQIMRDCRPEMFIVASKDTSTDEKLQAAYMAVNAQNTGYWGDDNKWRYTFHGSGCRIEHVETGETIEWDAPDEKVFDARWFIYYVLWLKRQPDVKGYKRLFQVFQHTSDEAVEQLLLERIADMQHIGLVKSVSAHNPNKLMLV